MYILGLGMFILLFGWFGFNAGSTLGITDGRFAEVAMVTMLGAAGGILGAYVATVVLQRTVDIGMVCNGLIAGLVAITAPSGYVENWAAPIIGIVGGLLVVPSIIADRQEARRPGRRPLGARRSRASGARSPAACSPRRGFAQYAGIGDPDGGLVYSGSFTQLGDQALGVVVVFALVLALCLLTWYAITKTIGLRVSEEAGDRRPRHLRARDVRLPGAVHPRRRAVRPAAAPPSIKLNGPAPATAGSAEAAPA